ESDERRGHRDLACGRRCPHALAAIAQARAEVRKGGGDRGHGSQPRGAPRKRAASPCGTSEKIAARNACWAANAWPGFDDRLETRTSMPSGMRPASPEATCT